MANTHLVLTVIWVGLSSVFAEIPPTEISARVTDSAPCDLSLEDKNVPHETDCFRYYRCVYGKKVPKICPEKMLFSIEIASCDLYYNVECPILKTGNNDIARGQTLKEAIMKHLTGRPHFMRKLKKDLTEIESHDKTTFSEDNKTSDASTAKFVYIPHGTDIRAYYKIENGEQKLLLCDEGMVFSFELEVCARPYGLK